MIPNINKIYPGDCREILKTFDSDMFDCSISSPPYLAKRNYYHHKQVGQETSMDGYINVLAKIYLEVLRTVTKTGSLFIVISDIPTPLGMPMIPFQLVARMQQLTSGFHVRLNQVIIWEKPNPPPFNVTQRFVDNYELILWITKGPGHFFVKQYEPYETDITKIKNIKFGGTKSQLVNLPRYSGKTWRPNPKGRLKRAVWRIPKSSVDTMHEAVYALDLVEQLIDAACPQLVCLQCKKPAYEDHQINDKGFISTQLHKCNCNASFRRGVVLDPFMGSGTTAISALNNDRYFVGIELNEYHVKDAYRRIKMRPQTLIA